MIDNERFERALDALELEEPHPRLRSRILASTVYRATPLAPAWEIWSVGTLLALAVWSLLWVLDGAGSSALLIAARRLTGIFSTEAMMWLAVGAAATVWIAFFSSSNRTPTTLAQ